MTEAKISETTARRRMPPKLEEDVATERVQIVAPATWVERVEEWRRAQPKIPSRSDAIRQLVDAGLEATAKKIVRGGQ